jgi:2-polyprenyl-6-methoxyphenol hydroxylase-like FAD-dependent oxidoreductase
MPPFAGVGVNVAMEDTLKLGRAIVSRKQELLGAESRNVLSEAIKEYEREMFPRAKENAAKSMGGLEMLFSEDAVKNFAEKKFASAGHHVSLVEE